MTEYLTPPKPVMALRVGVTGHRQSRLEPEHIDRITRQVKEVLATVARGVHEAHERYRGDYAETAPYLYFVSALADGADTLAAERALESDWRLLAPLPFLKQRYESDFTPDDRMQFDQLLDKADAIAELDGLRDGAVHEEASYLQAGIVTVHQSDFMIAIWDGEEARGVGGTEMIKEEALAAGKPVVWINATVDAPPVFLSAGKGETAFLPKAVCEVIDAVVAPPPSAEIEHEYSGKKTHALTAYRTYAAEKVHVINYGSYFQFWERLFAGRWPFSVKLTNKLPAAEIESARKTTLAEKMQASQHDQEVFNKLIIPRFVWADHLAIHYGNLYRSSYFFNYLFAATAVFLALFDLVAYKYGLGTKTVWITVEVTLIIAILGVTTAGKRGRWHEKWIDYRQLAEELRQYRLYFLTLGRTDDGEEFTEGEGGETAGWVSWYFSATRRESGMTSGSFNSPEIRLISDIILKEEIRPQIAYHTHKAKTLNSMEHRLHHLGEFAFALTLLICVIFLCIVFLRSGEAGPLQAFATGLEGKVKNWVTMLTGFLPALGAAFFGIRIQGEFGSTAERSHATAVQLGSIAAKFEEMSKAETPRLETLRVRVAEAARAMLLENMDWRLLYISKPLNLPG